MTADFGDIPVASKWNCPFFRGTGKGFLKDTVTSTFPFSFTVLGDAWKDKVKESVPVSLSSLLIKSPLPWIWIVKHGSLKKGNKDTEHF